MSKTLKRKLVELMDRRGGRRLLGGFTNRWVRSATSDQNIGVIYDDMWIDCIDGKYIPRSPNYNYYAFDLKQMRQRAGERLAGSIDYWTYTYKPKNGDVIIDVGAGVGIDALALSPLVGPDGHIYSIEAHPSTFRALKKTIQLNQLGNVTPIHLAISNEPGALWITTLENDEENKVSKDRQDNLMVNVPALDLDSFMDSKKIARIDFLKMNIEGSEEIAIQGMERSISKIRHIAIACHDFLGERSGTKLAIRMFLLDSGFDIFERPGDSRLFVRDHIHAIRRSFSN